MNIQKRDFILNKLPNLRIHAGRVHFALNSIGSIHVGHQVQVHVGQFYLVRHLVHLHLDHLVYLHVGHHVSHLHGQLVGPCGHHNAISKFCEGSETLTKWKSKKVWPTYLPTD